MTTPYSFTTLGWLNCPMMAASCRNLTVSSSVVFGFSVFTAISIVQPENFHSPLHTWPNCPDPNFSSNLISEIFLQLGFFNELCRFHNNHVGYNKACTLSQCFGYKSSHTLFEHPTISMVLHHSCTGQALYNHGMNIHEKLSKKSS